MTLPRLFDLTDYWLENPPTNLSVAGLVKAFSKRSGDGRGKRRVREGEYVPGPEPAKDKHGNPTSAEPKNLRQAAAMLNGGFHIMKPNWKPN